MLLTTLTAAALLNSCGGGGDGGGSSDVGGSAQGSIVYAATGADGGGKLYVFTANSVTGTLTDVRQDDLGSRYKKTIALHPTGKFAYIVEDPSSYPTKPSFTSQPVMAYSIAATGALIPPGSMVQDWGRPTFVTVDPTGTYLYVGRRGAHLVSSVMNCYAIDATTGATSMVWSTPFPEDPLAIAIDPTGKLAYVPIYGSSNIDAYSLNIADGTLTHLSASAAGHMFSIANTSPPMFAFDPLGEFLYVANFDSGDTTAFAINASTGALTSVGTYPAGVNPRSIALDPAGNFAYVVDSGAGRIFGYRVDKTTGALTSIGPSIATAGASPAMIVIDPAGKFAYVSGTFGLTMYGLNATTGMLSSIATVPTGGAAGWIAVKALP